MNPKKLKIQEILEKNHNKPIIFVDDRELKSKVFDFLKCFDVTLHHKKLDVADYICSKDVACERKTVEDFLQSIINKRIFLQLEALIDSYEKPVLIIEGQPNLLFFTRNMHENAIRGALASIAIDYEIPIIWTNNPRETASMLFIIAYREQINKKRGIQIRSGKKPKSLKEQQEFLVAGLPSVNTKLSRRLLQHFKTPSKVFSASIEDFIKVEKIGEKKAKKMWELLNKEYK
jgi:Fanconi anemia group M protein